MLIIAGLGLYYVFGEKSEPTIAKKDEYKGWVVIVQDMQLAKGGIKDPESLQKLIDSQKVEYNKYKHDGEFVVLYNDAIQEIKNQWDTPK